MQQLRSLIELVVLVVVLAATAAAAIWGLTAIYKTGARSRDAEVRGLEHKLEVAAREAKRAEIEAAARIGVITTNYLEAAGRIEIKEKEVIRYVQRTVPRDRLCLDAPTVRVLNALRDPGSVDPEGLDPGRAAEVVSPAAQAGGKQPDFRGGVSAQAVARWQAKAIAQYDDLRTNRWALVDTVKSLPCVKPETD